MTTAMATSIFNATAQRGTPRSLARHTYSHRPNDHVPTLTCFRPSNWDRVCDCVAYAWAGACAGVKCAATYTFDSVAAAGQWIHDNPGKAAIGTVVIVGGTAFIIVSGGSGALVLARARHCEGLAKHR